MAAFPDRIETDRLLLRAWTEHDVPAIDRAVRESLEHLRPWMPWIAAEPSTARERIERIRQWNEERARGGSSVVGVFLDGVVIGGAGLHRRVGPRAIEIGYWIHVAHVGRGYATEAVAGLTTVALTDARIDEVEIHHDRANLPSAAVARRLGYRLADEYERPATAPGEEGIGLRWIVTRGEWAQRDAQMA